MREMIVGILIGGGVVAVGKQIYRPLLKEGIKLALTASEAAQNAFHEGREKLTDIVAEARHEAEVERRAARIAAEDLKAQPAS